MQSNDRQIIMYLAKHPNSKLVTLCTELNMSVADASDAVNRLLIKGMIKSRGYASHVDEYYVPDGVVTMEIKGM